MNEGRIALLRNNSKFLSQDTRRLIDRFIKYSRNNVPVVTVLCSNNTLIESIKKKHIENNNDCYYQVFSVLEENDEIDEKIMFSDFIIVYTTALKIAPETLYKKMEYAQNYEKNFYVIIGGWNQVGRTFEKMKKKVEETNNTFSDFSIMSVYAESDYENEDFKELGEIFRRITIDAKKKYSLTKNEQEELLYGSIIKSINNDFSKHEKIIVRELIQINEYIEYVQKKQLSSRVVFKNSGVDLKEIPGDIGKKMLSGISTDYLDYVDTTKKININDLIEKVKLDIIYNFEKLFDNGEYTDINEDVKIKVDSLKKECVQDMMWIVSSVQKLTTVSYDLVDKLKDTINNSQGFDDFLSKENQFFENEMGTIKEEIKNAIGDISVIDRGYNRVERVKDVIGIVDAGLEYIGEAKEKLDNKETREESKRENYEKNEQKKIVNNEDVESNDKENDTFDFEDKDNSRLIDTELDKLQKIQLNGMIKAICEDANGIVNTKIDGSIASVGNRLSVISIRYVDIYFNSILNVMKDIKLYMERQKNECKRL